MSVQPQQTTKPPSNSRHPSKASAYCKASSFNSHRMANMPSLQEIAASTLSRSCAQRVKSPKTTRSFVAYCRVMPISRKSASRETLGENR